MADDSTTESEYFDDGDDGDCDERGGDALGGVSAQSSSSRRSDAPVVKAEPLPPAAAARPPAVKSEPLLHPPPPPPARPPSAPIAADVKPQLRELQQAQHVQQAQQAQQAAANGATYAALKANLPLRAGGLKAPSPLPVPLPRAPFTYGYQAPPPVDYAPPLLQSVAPARPVAAAAAGGAKATEAAPSRRSSSSSQQVRVAACGVCRAVLTNIPDLKIGWDCRCCGLLYPTQQFPTQDRQHRGPCRRCHACFKMWVAKQRAPGGTDTKPTDSSAQLPSLKLSSNPFPTGPPAAPRPTVAPAAALAPVPAPKPVRAPRSPPISRRSVATAPAPPAPASVPAPAPSRPVATAATASATPFAASVPTANRCKSCKRAMFRQAAEPPKGQILACRCCKLQLPKRTCFSKSQRKEGKRTCKACLGHAPAGADGFAAVPAQPTPAAQPRGLVVQTRNMRLKLNLVVLTAEREVAKFHNARRALLRKCESNDLRGSTRVEYEKQLEKEGAALKELEKELRAKHPALFDTQTGIKVIPPALQRDERDKPLRPKRKAAVKAVKGMRAERMAGKPKKVVATKKTLSVEAIAAVVAKERESEAAHAAAAVMRSLEPAVTSSTSGSLVVRKKPSTSVAATKRREIAAVPSAPLKPTQLMLAAAKKVAKRKAPAPASASALAASSVIVIEDDEKPPAKKHRAVQIKEVDPWFAAQQDIAQGLAELLGGNLAPDQPSAKPKSKSAPVDPSTYVPKTEFQAETPPRPTIVTRARRRSSQPVEIIEID